MEPEQAEELPVLRQPAAGVPSITDTETGLDDAIAALSTGTGPVAVDTERAQGFRYDPSARLVQLKRTGAGIFLIDTMALPDLTRLAPAMQAPWILHAPGGDLLPLEEIGLRPASIFDTEVAARLLGSKSFSLRGVCESFLGVTLEKTHQNEDWSLRPLPKDWLRYAALDVELLPDLYSLLSERLEKAGRLEWAREEFEHERLHSPVPRPASWQNIKGLSRIKTKRGLAVAKNLWDQREELGRQEDLAPTRVLTNAAIIEAALAPPSTRRKMMSIGDFRRPQAKKHADVWWSAIQKARNTPERDLPQKEAADPSVPPPARVWKRLDPDAFERLQAVRSAVDAAATPLELDPEVVLEPKIQRAIAWKKPVDFEQALVQAGARPWQIGLVLPHL